LRLRTEFISETEEKARMRATLDGMEAMIAATLSFARDDAAPVHDLLEEFIQRGFAEQVLVKGEGNFNLGVDGYEYEFSLNGEKVPLAPLQNTFSPPAQEGRRGFIVLEAQIQGKGLTGVNLRKNLQGSATMEISKLNIQIGKMPESGFTRGFLSTIAKFLQISEMSEAPIEKIPIQTLAGMGKIVLKLLQAQSSALLVKIRGNIPIAPVLGESTLDLPVHLAISKTLNNKLSMDEEEVDAKATYNSLPDFVQLVGTLNRPNKEIDMMTLGKFFPQLLGGATSAIGKNIGNTIKNLFNSDSSEEKNSDKDK
ncbi:MAG: hypothetical protein WCG27_08185, partial [Pseudomonadota bacterium]